MVNPHRAGDGYAPRRTNLDFRVAKVMRVRPTRTQVGVDIYNATNTDVVTTPTRRSSLAERG
jgi:hypothetical protein